MYGESKTSDAAQATMDFWDVAETMQPYRLASSFTIDKVHVFESSKIVSDLDVLAAVQNRTGQNISDLMKCSEAEQETKHSGRPEMRFWEEPSLQDVDYYLAENPREIYKTEGLERYLDTIRNPFAMADICYENCRTEVDAVLSKLAEGTDICEDDGLHKAVLCVEKTGGACRWSRFSTHIGECEREPDTDARLLKMSEDDVELSENAFEDGELLVNRSLLYASAFKAAQNAGAKGLKAGLTSAANLAKLTGKALNKAITKLYTYGKDLGLSEKGKQFAKDYGLAWGGKQFGKWLKPGMQCYSTWFNIHLGWYYYSDVETKARISASWYEAPIITGYSWAGCYRMDIEISASEKFSFEAGWTERKTPVGKYFVFWIKGELCVNVLKTTFNLHAPVFATMCVGGEIKVQTFTECPNLPKMSISGRVWKKLEAGLTIIIWDVPLVSVEFGVQAGHEMRKIQVSCWWKWNNGWGRRRWWTLRRRDKKVCLFHWKCDVYITGYVEVFVAAWKVNISVTFWVLSFCIEFTLAFYSWSWWNKCWVQDYHYMLWEQWLR